MALQHDGVAMENRIEAFQNGEGIAPAVNFEYILPPGTIAGQEISVPTPSGAQVDITVPTT